MKIIEWFRDFLSALLYPWGILFAIAGVIILCICGIGAITDAIFGYECVVVETGYYHSTNKENKCRFIASAKQHGYTIKKISESNAREKGYKICHYCFSSKEQKSYNELLKLHNDFKASRERYERYKDEDLGWDALPYKNDHDFSNLYVYIDKKSILHISACCMSFDIDSANKVLFNDVEEISSTCENCVERRFCDFIYKKIYEGIYDLSQIKEEEDKDDEF